MHSCVRARVRAWVLVCACVSARAGAGAGVRIRKVLHQVLLLFFFVTGFRGDWKALKQSFHFVRHYSTNEAEEFLGNQTKH